MSEAYSLESKQFKELEKKIKIYTEISYIGKRRISQRIPPEELTLLFRKDLHKNMRRFLHEYGMSYTKSKKDKLFFQSELNADWLQYILYVCKFLCDRSSGLKPDYTFQGKNAEGVVMGTFNSWLRYWRIPTALTFSNKSFMYGGDGGADFKFGSYKFDVKFRDDGPNTGLILDQAFLDRSEDDVILVFCTNSTTIKLGHSFTKKLQQRQFDDVAEILREQVFPLAIVGWISIGEFKARCTHRSGSPTSGRNSRWVVDDLNDISELFMAVVEDQICSSDLFVADNYDQTGCDLMDDGLYITYKDKDEENFD